MSEYKIRFASPDGAVDYCKDHLGGTRYWSDQEDAEAHAASLVVKRRAVRAFVLVQAPRLGMTSHACFVVIREDVRKAREREARGEVIEVLEG